MGQLNKRIPLVGKVPPWKQSPKPADPNAPQPFQWLNEVSVGPEAGGFPEAAALAGGFPEAAALASAGLSPAIPPGVLSAGDARPQAGSGAADEMPATLDRAQAGSPVDAYEVRDPGTSTGAHIDPG